MSGVGQEQGFATETAPAPLSAKPGNWALTADTCHAQQSLQVPKSKPGSKPLAQLHPGLARHPLPRAQCGQTWAGLLCLLAPAVPPGIRLLRQRVRTPAQPGQPPVGQEGMLLGWTQGSREDGHSSRHMGKKGEKERDLRC